MKTISFSNTLNLALATILLASSLVVLLPAQPAHAGDNGGTALDFDGVNDYVTAPLADSSITTLTVEMWLHPSRTTEDGIFAWEEGLGENTPFIYFQDTGSAFALYVDNGYRINTPLPRDEWTHIAVTYNGTIWSLYKNGTPAGTFSGGSSNRPGINLHFGYAFHGPWQGQIDDARIWNITRTQSEIQANMFSELTGSETNLIAYFKFNDGSGSGTAADSAGSNDGTLVNMDTAADWVTSTAPLGSLDAAYQSDITGMWGGQTDTASDSFVTGLDIADVSFLNDLGDDIIFGHNNAGFACCVTDNLTTTPNAEKRWDRIWELDVNDEIGTPGGSVDLTFDISDAGGQGSFSGTGNYYLLKRATGSTADFSEVSVVSQNIVGDQITFQVNVSELGSEFTLGADSASPTAIALQSFSAVESAPFLALILGGVVLAAGGLFIWKRRKAA